MPHRIKHTPGPWNVQGVGCSYTVTREIYGRPYKGVLVASVFRNANGFTSIHPDEQEANAHLIGAAPKLLAALKDALLDLEAEVVPKSWPSLDARIAACRTAIAEAEGRE